MTIDGVVENGHRQWAIYRAGEVVGEVRAIHFRALQAPVYEAVRGGVSAGFFDNLDAAARGLSELIDSEGR